MEGASVGLQGGRDDRERGEADKDPENVEASLADIVRKDRSSGVSGRARQVGQGRRAEHVDDVVHPAKHARADDGDKDGDRRGN